MSNNQNVIIFQQRTESRREGMAHQAEPKEQRSYSSFDHIQQQATDFFSKQTYISVMNDTQSRQRSCWNINLNKYMRTYKKGVRTVWVR